MLHITQRDVLEFANHSGDRNPVHVGSDSKAQAAFGGTIVHGMLTAIRVLQSIGGEQIEIEYVRSLDVEFRGEVRPDYDYNLTVSRDGDHLQAAVAADSRLRMSLHAHLSNSPLSDASSIEWLREAQHAPVTGDGVEQPVSWTPDEFRAGSQLYGVHRFREDVAHKPSKLTSIQEKVLELCSYIVGMKAPGLHSLFTRLNVLYSLDHEDSVELAYRLTFRDYNPHFRLLETELEVGTLDGRLIASAKIQSYVRFPRPEPDPQGYLGGLASSSPRLAGKVALICGASRGLGAELAAALGAAKCSVYLACRHPDSSTDALAERIRTAGGSAEILTGDVGDPQWCAAAHQHIVDSAGRLDLLILNACQPPRAVTVAHADPAQSAMYLSHNLTLSQTPLITFLPSIVASAGTVVAISSAFVEHAPPGFADYIAVKLSLEGTIKAAAHENEEAHFVIARPPKLQTSWNDTPTGAVGAIPPEAVAARIVDELSKIDGEANLHVIDSFPYQEPTSKISEDRPQLNIAFCANFTLDPIHDSLNQWSTELAANISGELAPYGQVLQQLLNPASQVTGSTHGSAIFLRISDWIRELPAATQTEQTDVSQWLHTTAREYGQAFKAHRAIAKGPTLVLVCPSDPTSSLEDNVVAEIEELLASELNELSGITVLNARSYHDMYKVPGDAIYDSLRNDIAHIPFQNRYYHFLATLVVRFFYRRLAAPKKVVVLDCDNTLWQGIVGEVGPAGIRFDPVHVRLHRRLCQLSESGVLLCFCSKNEEQDVWAVFDKRSDFILRREHVVASAINWSPKSENIRALARQLNLGLNSFIFIDDNPVECAEVRSSCPEVLTVQWPHDAEAATKLLDHLWELDIYELTSEDRQRTQMYREEFQRQQTQQQAKTFQDFIDSLQLKTDFEPLSVEDLARASQLTKRTNQFNFTSIRRSEAELQSLMHDPTHTCRTVRVSDRFGDYGLVGLFIASAMEGVLNVDTFLLSCRVLGRGVEHKMAIELARIAQEFDLRRVCFQHIPTERNTPARLFLSQIAPTDQPADPSTAWSVTSDVSQLLQLRFEAAELSPDAAKPIEADAGRLPESHSIRARERQIERIAGSMATYAQLAQAFGSQTLEPAGEDLGDVSEAVLAVFARALRLSSEEVRRIDRLDAMDCDSLRIVDITVALTRRFHWLPKTLLFEHRKVSEIINQIAQLQKVETTPARINTASAAPADRSTQPTDEIAIVGVGVRCAGGNSPDALWEFLAQGQSGIRLVPEHRDIFVGRLTQKRTHYAGLIDGASEFDPEFFGISPREAEYMDPQLRLLLQTAWQALEDAGSAGDAFDVSCGIFVGAMYSCYSRFANAVATQTGSSYRCWESFSLANRLSQVLGCNGPSLSIDTACSSSATALHYACESLRNGDCCSAIVSGVNLLVDPDRLVQFKKLGILSASGRCVPFGDEADGTVIGEGAVSVVLRPLQEARRRGDRVYAIIKGSGVSSGAGSVGFTAPNPVAQAEAARRALAAAQIDPRTVSYIEAHGTGTELGDPIEVRGLELAYGDRRNWLPGLQLQHSCTIGSIKPNVGHLEAGAGLMGIIKVALQLYHRQLLPSLTSEALNRQINFAELPFDVQRSLSNWSPQQATVNGERKLLPLRAGVNSFGVGGSNVHVILEHAPSEPAARPRAMDRPVHLLTLSATSEPALRLQATAWQSHLEKCGKEELANACFSANVGRKHHAYRSAVMVPPLEGACETLEKIAKGQTPVDVDPDMRAEMRIAFLFTGQGAQYPRMFWELHQSNSVFRKAFDECAGYLNELLPRPIDEVMFQCDDDDRQHPIHQTSFTQPALFAVQYSLFELWKSWGIIPDIVMGHSIGEIAAYCVAGGCALPEAAQLVAARGRLMQQLPAGGSMYSLPLGRESIEAVLQKSTSQVSIAAVNGPNQTVISGRHEAVAQLASQLESMHGIKGTQLSVSHAFHSALMEPMLSEFENVLRALKLGLPETPIVSSATGSRIDGEMSTPEYWLKQARNPVLFTDAMTTLDGQGVTHYVELGPHPVMLSMGRQCLANPGIAWLPSAKRGQADWAILLSSLGKLFVDGASVDWSGFDAPYSRKRISVPAYQFNTRRIWLEELEAGAFGVALPTSSSHSKAANVRADSLSYEINWIEMAGPSKRFTTTSPGAKWLVLSESVQALDVLYPTLFERGIDCIAECLSLDIPTTTATKNWPGKSERELLRARSQLEALIQRHGPFDRIIYIDWPPAESFSSAEQLQDRSVDKIVQLCQVLTAVASQSPSTPGCFWIVTTRSAVTGHDTSLSMESAPIWGFARVAAQECDAFWGGLIDVDELEDCAERLIDEIGCPAVDDQIVFRGTLRLVPRLSRRKSTPIGQPINAKKIDFSSGTILITGGLGAIGIHVATWLMNCGARRLILSSRNGTPSAESQAALDALTSQGVEVAIVAADISTAAGVQACLSAVGDSKLIGVVHAAGIDLRQPILSTSRDDVERVFAAKVRGAWLLHQVCQNETLQFFVCCSSISTIVGSAERSAYAAANAFLDALAHHRRHSGLVGMTVNFGPWSGGGMADPASLAQFERIGNRGLEPAQTLQVLEQLIDQASLQTIVADIDWTRFRPILESCRPKPLLGVLGSEPPATTSSPTPTARGGQAWLETLRNLSADDRPNKLIELIQGEVAQTLRMPNPRCLPINRNLFEIGMDSITAVEFSIRLQKQAGMQISNFLVSFPTIRRIAEKVMEHLNSELAGNAAPQNTTESVESQTAGPAAPASDASQLESQGIIGYSKAIEPKIFQFYRTAWPERHANIIEPRWKWMFLESAKCSNVEPKVWLYKDGNQIVGHTGAQFVRFKIGDAEKVTAYLVETMILESHRDRGIGARIMLQAQQDMPFSLSLGQTEQMRMILNKLDWEHVAPLQTYFYPINASRVLKGKLPPAVASLGAGWIKMRAGTTRLLTAKSTDRVSVRTITRFDSRHDRLWRDVSGCYGCATVRDAAYLNWKFADQPGQAFELLEISKGTKLIACVVISLAEPNKNYSYRRANIVEWVASNKMSHLHAVIRTAVAHCREREADSVTVHLINPTIEKALKNFGFMRRSPTRHLVISTDQTVDRKRLFDPSEWLVTQGDSDIDRPW